MDIIASLKSLALMYDTNRLYINNNKTNYYMYHKDMDFHIFMVRKKKSREELERDTFRRLRTDIKKMIAPKPVKIPDMIIVPDKVVEDRFQQAHHFKGVINHILKNNSNVQLEELIGIYEIRYNPEINAVNLITNEFYIMESIFFNQPGQITVSPEWVDYIKGAYLDRLVNFQVSAAKYYIEHCTAGIQGNTPVSGLQGFRTMRLQPQMYPIFMKLSDDEASLLGMESKFNQPLLNDISKSFSFTKSLEATSLYGKLLKDLEEHQKGFVLFSTKKDIAEFLRLKTDYVDIETIMRIIIGKFMKGFYGVNEKNYKIEYTVNNAKDTTIVYHNQLCTFVCKGVPFNIIETVDESDYYKVITKNYMDNYEYFDTRIKTRATVETVVAERFGGLNILREPDMMQALNRFKEVLS